MVRMNDICKLTLFSGLVVNYCADTFSVAKACVLPLQHRQFVRCDLDSESVALNLSQTALVLACQVLNE